MNTITQKEKQHYIPEVLTERPPIYDKVVTSGLHVPTSAIFAYDTKIYNPSGAYLHAHIIVHECTHLKQQADNGGAEAWWMRYLQDAYFRIQQETEAYATQYAFICESVKDRNQRFRVLNDLAGFLSGPMYGSMIPKSEAIKIIRLTSNVK